LQSGLSNWFLVLKMFALSRLATRTFVVRANVAPAGAASTRVSIQRAVARPGFSFRTVVTKRYTNDHEWVEFDTTTGHGTVSITDYAQKSLGDVVFVELPTVGAEFGKGDLIGAVESVKAASDIYAPLSGKVLEVNQRLNDEPGLLNKSPEGEGWLCKIHVTKPNEIEELLDDIQYKELTDH